VTVSPEILPLLVVLVVVLLAGVGLVVGLRRPSRRRPGPRATSGPGREPGETRTETGARAGVDTVAPPAAGTELAPLEIPEGAGGRLVRLRARLAKSGVIGTRLLAVLSRDHLTESDWEEIEETLLLADVGAGPTSELMGELRTRVKVLGSREPAAVRAVLQDLLLDLVGRTSDRSLHLDQTLGGDGALHPATVLVVGVNGTGKTTTVGKLARFLVAEDHDVVLGAADTFRAAAADQLQTWGQRVGVPVIRADRDHADPASVAFDAVRTGQEMGADVVLVDTAGRLQNKADLMDELGKIKRVISRRAPVAEVLLVLDATTGQNGLRQARVFTEVVQVTGIVLTKLDGTAKGGIVVAVQRELGVPVKFVGIGEGPDDLAPFDPEAFVDALLT
jgi:fused signal recognition particle receptor